VVRLYPPLLVRLLLPCHRKKQSKKEKKSDRHSEHKRSHRHRKDSEADKEEKKPRSGRRRSHSGRHSKEDKNHESSSSSVVFQKLFKSDPHLRVVYAIKVSASEPQKIALGLMLNNASDDLMTGIKFTIQDTLNIKLISPAVLDQLPSRQKSNLQLIFQFESLKMSQKLKGSVTYSHHVGGDIVDKKVGFELTFPCSAFVVPVKITPNHFADLLSADGGNMSLSSTTVDITGKDLSAVFRSLTELLHVAVVEQRSSAASFYGKSVQDHHVVILAKSKGDSLSVELKCTEPTFGGSLIAEVTQHFKK